MRNQVYTKWEDLPIVFDLIIAARILGKSYAGMKHDAQRGLVPGAFKNGKLWRVSKQKFMEYVEGGAGRNDRENAGGAGAPVA